MMGETPREIAGAGADISDGFRGLQIESHHHLVRLLPLIPRRVFQYLGVLFRGRRVVLVRHLSQCHRRKERRCEE